MVTTPKGKEVVHLEFNGQNHMEIANMLIHANNKMARNLYMNPTEHPFALSMTTLQGSIFAKQGEIVFYIKGGEEMIGVLPKYIFNTLFGLEEN